ncbi:MAG: hydroxyacid dehydrogenase [Candidatus Latescibacterota bacterium]
MNIVIFEVESWERDTFRPLESIGKVHLTEEPLNSATMGRYRDADIISTFIYSKLDHEILRSFKHLQLIATRSTGVDHIDLDFCSERHILVANVPTYGVNTVAEHTFGLILTISHRIAESVDRTRRGDFSLEGLRGFDLLGKTLGVIGTGDIGRYVIKLANGFDMRVAAYDVKPVHELESEYGFRYVGMDELLAISDIITLHVPAIRATHHLISDDAFGKMKAGVVLINTARGDIVDSRALVRALSEGKVAAAGLDVLPEEPVIREEAELLRSVYRKEHNMEDLLADCALLRLRNVIITPHNAFNTREAVQRIVDATVENISSFTRGEPLNIITHADRMLTSR